MAGQTHHQAEQAHHLTPFLTNALDAIVITDLHGQIVEFNPAAERLFLLERAEVLGLDLHACIIPPHQRIQHRLAMARGSEQVERGAGPSRRVEVEYQRSDGRWMDFQLSLTTLSNMGKHYFVASIQEMTERKQSIKALNDALLVAESSNRAISDFLAHINHAMRTSLQALLGLTSLGEQDGLPKEWSTLVRQIDVAGHSLLGNINNILDFSTIESGTVRIERLPFQPGNLLDTLSSVLSNQATNRNVKLLISPFLEDRTLQVYGDEMRLEQILTNLASHAMGAIEQGSIEILVNRVDEGAQQVTLGFAVRDTRIEIPLDKRHAPALSGSQEASVTTRYGGQSDLSVTISQRLVAMMGGKMEQISASGRGGAFWFTLTFDRVQEAGALVQEASTPTLPQGMRLAALRLLVADDCAINRQVARHLFTKEGADVVLAENGQEAVDWLLAHPGTIDLVIMDIQMPIMDGYEAVRLIRNTPALAKLPVLGFTSGTIQEQRDKSGMTGFIAKPFKAEAAIQQIQALTGKQEKSAPPATPFPIPLADPAAAPFPGLAVENGLAVWKSAPIYRQYLSKFAHTYVDVVRDIREAERTKAASLAHKLKGAAGSLALEEVAALASEVDKRLRGEADPTDGLVQLQAALDIALESIHCYVQGDATTGTVSSDAKTGL